MSSKIFLLYPISGLLIGAALIYPWAWFLGIGGLSLCVWLLYQQQSKKQLYYGVYFSWIIKSLCAIVFFWSIYPIEFVPSQFNALSLLSIAACWLGVGAVLGVGGIVIAFYIQEVKKKSPHSHYPGILLLPFVWIFSEVISSYAFSIFSIGPGGTINPNFSFGYVGYILSEHSLLVQGAQLAGVYSLSIMLVALAAGLAVLYNQKQHLALAAFLSIILATSGLNTVSQPESKETVRVAIITTSFPVQRSTEKDNLTNLQTEQAAAFSAAAKSMPDYIIWPEDTRFIDQNSNIESSKNVIQFLYPSTTATIIDSSRVTYGGHEILQGIVFDPVTNEHNLVHKQYLVPQGEFIPSLYKFVLGFLGFDSLVAELETFISFRPGPIRSQSHLASTDPGILFCFEATSPLGVKKLMRERDGIPFIAHPVSHAWFHEPEEVWHQLDAALRIQSIWNSIPIVTAAGHAESKVYLPTGEVFVPDPSEEGEFWSVSTISLPVK